MAEDLFLRLHGEHVEWMLLDEPSGIVRFRGDGDWSALEAMASDMDWNGDTHVLIPGESVLLTSAVVPSKQMRQILQAVPYMVEEHLASDADDCHFAVGERLDGGGVRVAAIDRDEMARSLERLAAAGIAPTTMTADSQHIRRPSAGACVLIDGDRALIVLDDGRAMAMETSALPVTLGIIGRDEPMPVEIMVPEGATETMAMVTSQIEAEQSGLEVTEIDYSPFEQLCRSFETKAVNLLQGEFAVEEARGQRGNGWRFVAILAGCAFALHIMLLIVQGIYLDVRATQYERQARALYAKVFPEDTNVRDLRRRWQSRIKAGAGQGGDAFLDVFARAALQLPGTRLRLENVNFNETRGDMSLQLMADESSEFVRFSQALTTAGLDAEVGTISQTGEGARGNIKIRTGP
ncbi:MAG: type II secretion system protein GspL [Gammaproteobacteria bacterium]|nr:type II secretion system protein GspL [Gammaproteobacteria bacterium]